jgi:DNA-binding NarL/FixJ family response regulator
VHTSPNSKLSLQHWQERLLRRRHRFPASDDAEQDFDAFIDHGGIGFFFPLGAADGKTAAAMALRIYQVAVEKGWNFTCQNFTRELIVSLEWCMDPVLWTYTTIRTLVGSPNGMESLSSPASKSCLSVLLLESDAGIRRALCRNINQQPGLFCVPCDSAVALRQALAQSAPYMFLLNRNDAARIGLVAAGIVRPIRPGVPALTYSVHVNREQMLASSPEGAAGYLVRCVKSDRLLEPAFPAANRLESTREDFLPRVKYYFQELLQLPSSHDNPASAKLTHREREVLALLSKGCVDKEIAQAMGISAWTVHGHIKHIFERLQVRSRTEAVIRYLHR